ncbi:arylsulfatase [Prevotella sp. MGM1]|nr:arylsulfatase [Prevotella sp. MGM1]
MALSYHKHYIGRSERTAVYPGAADALRKFHKLTGRKTIGIDAERKTIHREIKLRLIFVEKRTLHLSEIAGGEKFKQGRLIGQRGGNAPYQQRRDCYCRRKTAKTRASGGYLLVYTWQMTRTAHDNTDNAGTQMQERKSQKPTYMRCQHFPSDV